jgi:hypothetical protein
MLIGSLHILQSNEESALARLKTVAERGGIGSAELKLHLRPPALPEEFGLSLGKPNDGTSVAASEAAAEDFDGLSDENKPVPSVVELQQLLEHAWSLGFDPEGASIFQPGGGVLDNTRWIGKQP